METASFGPGFGSGTTPVRGRPGEEGCREQSGSKPPHSKPLLLAPACPAKALAEGRVSPLHHSTTPSLHHSITPPLHHSTTPSLHHSTTPSLHHSITPPLHHSTTPAAHQYITKSLYFMIPALQPCLLPRILSLFAAIQCKCPSINHLHKQMSFSSRA